MKPLSKIRVAVLEDESSYRACLRMEINRSPGLVCVGAFGSCEEAFSKFDEIAVDVVLVDIGLPMLDGIEGIREFQKRWPRVKALVLTGNESKEVIFAAFGAGARGYLKKSTPKEQLAEAIRAVHHGGVQVSPEFLRVMVDFFHTRQSLVARLSPRERAVLAARDAGRSHKEVAQELGIGTDGVKHHLKNILRKLGAASSAEAAYLTRRAAGF